MKKIFNSGLILFLLSACSAGPALNQNPGLLRAQAAGPKKLQIRLFRSYGNEQQAHIRARVMKPENLKPESPDDSALTNLWRNLMSLTVKEAAGIQVDFSLNGKTQRLVSDAEGMIQVPSQAFGSLAPGIYTIKAELAPGQNVTGAVSSEKFVVQAAADSSLGIVSDIDDTIKISYVTNKLKSLRRLMFKNSYTVEPVPGTAVLYQKLEQNLDGQADGDITYVSGSPINLSEQIYGFLDNRTYPAGAVELKKWGFGAGDDSPFAQQSYKITRLRQLLTTYPQRSYLLFGDSGEKDPEIYKQLAAEFPGRVKGIFINNVTNSQPSEPRFAGTHLTRNSLEAAQILNQQGLLSAADVEAVRQAFSRAGR